MDDFSRKLYIDTKKALDSKRYSALGLLSKNPKASSIELAKQLGDESSAFGLTIALYKEALASNNVRFIAKDLLFREILRSYPKGWSSSRKICPAVYLVNWITDFKDNVPQKHAVDAVDKIYNDIVRDDPPVDGWIPQTSDDPYLAELFNRHWSIEPSTPDKPI